MQLENVLSAFTQLGASWVLWFLLVLSVVCLAVIAERVVCYVSTRANGTAMATELARMAAAGKWSTMQDLLSASPSFEARVAAAGLSGGASGADARMHGVQEDARLELEKHLALLGTVGANAPFVGLLGTVIGIIGAFRELERTQGLLSGVLMREIGEALVATAVGLLVALPAVAAFNLFRRVVQRRLSGIQTLRETVAGLVQARASERASDGQ